jgi:hypothetical protein
MNIRKTARLLSTSTYLVSRWAAQGKLRDDGSAADGWVLRVKASLVRSGGERNTRMYKIKDMAKEFGVTVRTITNWKRKGVVVRVYDDEEMMWMLRVAGGWYVKRSLHPVRTEGRKEEGRGTEGGKVWK